MLAISKLTKERLDLNYLFVKLGQRRSQINPQKWYKSGILSNLNKYQVQ